MTEYLLKSNARLCAHRANVWCLCLLNPNSGCMLWVANDKVAIVYLIKSSQAIEVAKTPQPVKDKKKAGHNGNTSAKSYYFHDESVNDTAVRSRLLTGYEDFKVRFTALSNA